MLKLKLFISFALTSLLTMTGCLDNSTGNNSSDLDKALIGEWELEQNETGGYKSSASGITYIFNSNGTYEKNIVGLSQSGTWKTKDGTLYLNEKNTPEYSIDYTFEESQLVITEEQTIFYYGKTGETGGGETGGGETGGGETNPLIGEWELYKVDYMGEILEEGDPDWEDHSIIITSNKLISTSDGVEESANYTCNNGQIITEYEYEGEIVKDSISYSIESENILILSTEFEGMSLKQFFRKL